MSWQRVFENPTRVIDLGQDGKILITTDDKWKDFVYGVDVPEKVRRSEFDWLDDAEGSDHFFKYRNTWYHLSQFERTAGGGAAGSGMPMFEAAGWQGAHPHGFSVGVLVKISADGEQYKVASYRVTGS